MLGVWQLVLIFAIVLVLFGAGKIPQIMKDLGSGIKAFKKGFDDEEGEIDVEMEAKKYSKQQASKAKPNKKITRGSEKNKKKVIKGVRKNTGKVDNVTKKKPIVKKTNKNSKKNIKN